MTKAQQMLAKAGFPDTKVGRAAFHKMYKSPEDFFKVHGNIFEDFPELVPMKLPIKPENVILNHSPDRDYYLENTPVDSPETDDDTDMYKSGGSIHIKPSHKGRFTAYKKRTGKTTEEALHSKNPHVRQMANFARNAAKWKHENGGEVMYGPGGPIGISSVTTNNTIQNGDNYTSRFETGIADTEGFRQFYKQDTPGSYVHYAGSPNHEQLNVNGAYINDPFMQNFLYQRAGNKAANGYKNGGTVDALQLMGMPTPRMYGPGSRVENNFHPSLNLSTAISPVPIDGKSFNDVTFKNAVSNSITGSIPLFSTGPNQGFRLAGDYTYTNNPNDINNTSIPSLELQWAGGEAPGEGANRFTPSRRFDNHNIAHRGKHGNLGGFGNIHAGISKVGEGYIPYAGLEAGANIGIGRLPRSGGLPKGTAYLKVSGDSPIGGALNNVDKSYYLNPNSPLYSYDKVNASSNSDWSVGGTYNFNKNLSIYGEAGLRSGTNNSPRFEAGLTKTFAQGGPITHYIPSYNFGHVQSANNTYRHGYANGGYIGKYDFGSTIKDIGAAAYGVGEATLDTATMGMTDQLTDQGYKALQKVGGTTDPNAIKKQDLLHGAGEIGGAIIGGVATGNVPGAINQGLKGANDVIQNTNMNENDKANWSTGINLGRTATAFMGGNGPGGSSSTQSVTPMGSTNFGTGTAGGNLSNFGIGFAAMGGAVNAPNMMKYDDGGMTQQGPTQINVERGELLVNKDGKILTEYRGGGMVPHPSDGSMDPRGTVPAQEGQFVITKKLAPNYKFAMENNDRLYATAMRNNIAFDKQRKEAKEQAQQQMMQDMMSAKFGGMVGQYGYGGGVMKYDGGSTIYNDINTPFKRNTPFMSANNMNSIDFTAQPWGFHQNNVNDNGIATSLMNSNYSNRNDNKMVNWNSIQDGSNPPTPPPGLDPNYFKYQRMLAYGAPAALGLEALLSKPFNMNPNDYQIKGRVDPYEEEYVPDYRPYNAAVANLNRMPGSGNLAARTNLFNAMQQQQDDARYKISLGNAQRKMGAQQANLGIEGQNLSTAMSIAQFNEQNKAARRNAIREQFGKNLPAVAYNDMANQMAMAGMSAAYPTYPFPWNKKNT